MCSDDDDELRTLYSCCALLGSMCVPKTMMIYSLGAHGALLHEGSVAIISGCGCSA